LTRKFSLIAALLIFIVASGACGAAQSMTQLYFISPHMESEAHLFHRIIFRSFQGIGGAGCFSIAMVVFFELIPKEKYAKYGSIVSADIAFATLLGPLFGGIITDNTTWRWVFLIKYSIRRHPTGRS
jgi:MFS family permease